MQSLLIIGRFQEGVKSWRSSILTGFHCPPPGHAGIISCNKPQSLMHFSWFIIYNNFLFFFSRNIRIMLTWNNPDLVALTGGKHSVENVPKRMHCVVTQSFNMSPCAGSYYWSCSQSLRFECQYVCCSFPL